jgi:hypothetical protein
MRRCKWVLIPGILAVTLLATAAVAASLDGLALRWYAITGGGGRSSSASYVVQGSAAQPAVGALSSASYRLGAGFWHGVMGGVAPNTPTATRTLPAPATATPTGSVTPRATATRTATARSRIWLPALIRQSP